MKKSLLTAYGSPLTNIIIEETAGIDRTNEPVTVGIPFPKGMLKDTSVLGLMDPESGHLPLQTKILATWPDNSLKWVLLDFQTSIKAQATNELSLIEDESENTPSNHPNISVEEGKDYLRVNTGATSFFVNRNVFKPFETVVIDATELLDPKKSRTILTVEDGTEYDPVIDNMFFETKGSLRSTLKMEGKFKHPNKSGFASFFSRINFFVNSPIIRMEFTILNPRAAKHPGGLWDLGDPGSIFFKDLSINTALKVGNRPSSISYHLSEDFVPMDYQQPLTAHCSPLTADYSSLTIYQDSSGGENWKSRNHVNRNNEVKTSFRGYRIYEDGKLGKEGLRANPIISLKAEEKQISGAVQYFWQNFPKALEAKENTLIIRLFPTYYNDVFELQGGEQKTHTIFLDFGPPGKENPDLEWTQNPLIPHTTPEWYYKSGAFHYLIPESDDPNEKLIGLINTAIKGKNTFFYRREIIDEYGWRNFGEFYADHEAVGHERSDPLISHYNNQYDCIYGALMQFMRSGDLKWFLLADQLCQHVKDIDIYHTDKDRPENNRGLFWHTEHYINAQTATHRCFSRKHLEYKQMNGYGGGPSISHNYSTGLLFHYYMTGDPFSREAVIELATNIQNNIDMGSTLLGHIIKGLRKFPLLLKFFLGKGDLVDLFKVKVYGFNGPGRESGNSINTLLNAYCLTNNRGYLERADHLITRCIHPNDDIDRKDLLDVENKWMYVIFLQSLGKYLDIKAERSLFDEMWYYVKQSLLHYANWMVKNEHLYLEKPEKLEYPNETWAAQDIRKCNILLYALKYYDASQSRFFLDKASFFYHEAINYLMEFETKTLTRPIALIMLNDMMYNYWKNHLSNSIPFYNCCEASDIKVYRSIKWHKFHKMVESLTKFSLKNEIQFLKWRIISKL